MRTGSIDGILGMGGFQTIYDSGELASAQTSITISNLDGDNDKEYFLIARIINGYNGGTFYYARPNNDSGSNYGFQMIRGADSTTYASRFESDSLSDIGYSASLNSLTLSETLLYAKSGYIRTAITKLAQSIVTTTVTGIKLTGQVWNNTADNITSLVIFADQSNGFGIGSRIILMKKSNSTSKMKTGNLNVQGKVKGTFQKIYKTTLTSAATSVTISGLDGNTDQLYRLKVRHISNAASSNCGIRPNNDSTANIYGVQDLNGTNTTSQAARTTYNLGYFGYNASASGNICLYDMLLYAKSGYIRTALVDYTENIATTTVNDIGIKGMAYNETATNITSLVILNNNTDGLGIGTVIELEAYRS